MTEYRLAMVTAGSQEEADRIAEALVEERLAACVNLLPGITSVYRWQGKVERDPEVKLFIKTRAERCPALIQRVRELHSYEVCEVTVLPILDGNPDYLGWIGEQTR